MTAPINAWGRQRVAMGLLVPDIQKMLLQGKAPPHITPDMLLNSDIPMDWDEERRVFGLGWSESLLCWNDYGLVARI